MSALNSLRKYIALTAAALGAGGAWGVAVAILLRITTPISENTALLLVALPVGVAVAIWLWPRLPRILGFSNDSAT